MRYERVVLPNGLRVLVSDMPEARSVSIAVYVGVGSRAETRANAGASHFVEHMVFKGTAKRPTAADISQEIESRGGAVNASTDKEVTVFWSRVPARHYLVALDVVADMVRAPLLRDEDVEGERRVVIEELRMYRDQPQDRVHTLVEGLLYPRHPLGWEIAGSERVVRGLQARDLREFMARGYAPHGTVVALAGPLDPAEAIAAVEAALGGMPVISPPPLARAPRPGTVRTRLLAKRGEQAHLCVGWRTVSHEHDDRYALDILNAVLGDGMASRLFLELRERRGLAYDVSSDGTSFVDAGHLVVYAGVAPERAGEALEAVLLEIGRLCDDLVPPDELERIRDYIKGRTELRLEDTRGVSSWLAGQELFHGRVRTIEEICGIIDGIGAEDIRRVARRYLRPELAYVAAIGPRTVLGGLVAPSAEPVAVESAS